MKEMEINLGLSDPASSPAAAPASASTVTLIHRSPGHVTPVGQPLRPTIHSRFGEPPPPPAPSSVEPEKLTLAEVCRRLRELGVPFSIVSNCHVKIGAINFYTPRGRIYIDGEEKYAGSGFRELRQLLVARRLLRG